jgi:hypothetical protein
VIYAWTAGAADVGKGTCSENNIRKNGAQNHLKSTMSVIVLSSCVANVGHVTV